jgi:hypothetical protein
MTAHFEGDVEARWLVEEGPDRRMVLVSAFTFVDSTGYRWEAKAGEIIDGASIPKELWNQVVGTPFTGDYRRAAVVHDVACARREKTSKEVHRMFYEAMICDGTDKTRALLFYTAVRLFGPQWPQEVRAGQISFRELERALDGGKR